MSPLFPHSAAWAIVVALLALLLLWHWQSASQPPEPRIPRIASPLAQRAQDERVDRHDYDERAFADDAYDCPAPPFAPPSPSRRPLSDAR
jgi:hypothetical protein